MVEDLSSEQTYFKMITRLLDNIGLAMYSSIPRAIAELVANSYDADSEVVKITIPVLFGAHSEIIIQDFGEGMSKQQIDEEYMVLGYDKRKDSKKTTKGRLPLGNKGIGKLAGLGIAQVMYVESVKEGIKSSFLIDKKELDEAKKPLSEIPISIKVERTSESNGTTIYLRRLLPRATGVSPEELLTFLTVQFGLRPDFRISVNNIWQSAKSIPGERFTIKEAIPDCGEVTGFYTVAEKATYVRTPGFIVRVRGRCVLGPTVFDVFTSGQRQAVFTTSKIIGEINADFLDPEMPIASYDEFIITTPRDNFNESDPKFLKLKDWAEKKLRQIASETEHKSVEERKKRVLEDKRVASAIKRLPPNMQEYVLELLNNIIPKLKDLSEEDAEFIIGIILRASESSEFLEILKKMHETPSEDIGKLALLLQDWGLYEITAITELIKNRLSVIDQFEKFAKDINTLEYQQIHKTLENNLWLLNDNYKLYGSNQALKRLLDNKIQSEFQRHENDRPDIVCKELLDKLVIIELKRPSHKITSQDWVQLMQYRVIVRTHCPSYNIIECYLVGNSYDEAVRDKNLESYGYFLRSYSEIITQAKNRYKEIIQILLDANGNELPVFSAEKDIG